MRDYSKVLARIWIGKTGKEIKSFGPVTTLLAHYLISSPHAHMSGAYYLPQSYMAHESGLSVKDVPKALQNLISIDFCTYDESTEYVWVHNMARYQVGEELHPKDNMVKHMNKHFKNLPKVSFLTRFYEKYRVPFYLKERKDLPTLSEGASEVVRSQEQEQETEHETEQDEEECVAEPQSVSALETGDITIPLKNGDEFLVSYSQVEKWQKAYNKIDVRQILKIIQDWNTANPRKRKCKTGITRHITLWLAREQEKAQRFGGSSKPLFSYNQSIADEWLRANPVDEGGVH